MKPKDFVSCYRAGTPKRDEVGKPLPRSLIVKMVSKEVANFWTKNGMGYQCESGYCVNKDLCQADRHAHFLARQ